MDSETKTTEENTMNPRYKYYLRTTNSPTNWGFQEFIGKMLKAYGEDRGLRKPLVGPYYIDNQDTFTAFIKKET